MRQKSNAAETEFTIRQPKVIRVGGKTYRRLVKWQQLDDPRFSVGPFYSRRGVDPEQWVFMPDSAYLKGQTTTPTMHVVQTCHTPTQPKPTA